MSVRSRFAAVLGRALMISGGLALFPQPASAATSYTVPAAHPDAPTVVRALPNDTSATISFRAPAGNGAAVTGYTVTSSPGRVTATCAASPCPVYGLTNGLAYTFTVVATNRMGDSPASTASNSTTPAALPGLPTGVVATAAPGRATVAFIAPSGNGSAVTGYTATSSPEGRTGSCPASPCTVTGLANGTSYTFSVVATNGVGDSVASGPSTPIVPAARPRPPATSPPRPPTARRSPGTTRWNR